MYYKLWEFKIIHWGIEEINSTPPVCRNCLCNATSVYWYYKCNNCVWFKGRRKVWIIDYKLPLILMSEWYDMVSNNVIDWYIRWERHWIVMIESNKLPPNDAVNKIEEIDTLFWWIKEWKYNNI